MLIFTEVFMIVYVFIMVRGNIKKDYKQYIIFALLNTGFIMIFVNILNRFGQNPNVYLFIATTPLILQGSCLLIIRIVFKNSWRTSMISYIIMIIVFLSTEVPGIFVTNIMFGSNFLRLADGDRAMVFFIVYIIVSTLVFLLFFKPNGVLKNEERYIKCYMLDYVMMVLVLSINKFYVQLPKENVYVDSLISSSSLIYALALRWSIQLKLNREAKKEWLKVVAGSHLKLSDLSNRLRDSHAELISPNSLRSVDYYQMEMRENSNYINILMLLEYDYFYKRMIGYSCEYKLQDLTELEEIQLVEVVREINALLKKPMYLATNTEDKTKSIHVSLARDDVFKYVLVWTLSKVDIQSMKGLEIEIKDYSNRYGYFSYLMIDDERVTIKICIPKKVHGVLLSLILRRKGVAI